MVVLQLFVCQVGHGDGKTEKGSVDREARKSLEGNPLLEMRPTVRERWAGQSPLRSVPVKEFQHPRAMKARASQVRNNPILSDFPLLFRGRGKVCNPQRKSAFPFSGKALFRGWAYSV